MNERGLMGQIEAELVGAGIGDLLVGDVREHLETFIREVVLWSGRIHLVGKSNIRKTLSTLVIDSFLLLDFARRTGALNQSGEGDAEHDGSRSLRSGRCERKRSLMVADIGSSAGFPGIIWKIGCPDLDVTLFERKEKYRLFLEHVISVLGVEALRALGEDASRYDGAHPFDLVVSKAAGRMKGMLPIARELLCNGGVYVTVKGRGWEEELAMAGETGMALETSEYLPEHRGAMVIFRKRGV